MSIVAWLHRKHPMAYVITDRVKQIWESIDKTMVENYTEPLVLESEYTRMEQRAEAAEQRLAAMPDRNAVIEGRGTFACPICGYDKPHGHPEEVEQAYRNDQIRNDGWTSAAKILPSESGWYLCAGIDVPLDQKDRTKEYEKWSQLSWFKWVRNAEGNEDTLEVLYYDVFEKKWILRNMLGDAVRSGTDLRWRVRAEPKYWRVLPSYPNIHALKVEEGK